MAKRNVNVFGSFFQAANISETPPERRFAVDANAEDSVKPSATTPVGKAMTALLKKIAEQQSNDLLTLSKAVTSPEVTLPLFLESLSELQKLGLVRVDSQANPQSVSVTPIGRSLIAEMPE